MLPNKRNQTQQSDNPFGDPPANQPAEAEEPTMFSYDYQRAMLILGKRYEQPADCCDRFLHKICKYLIHIFIVVISVSFLIAISNIDAEEKEFNYEDPKYKEVERRIEYMKANPHWYQNQPAKLERQERKKKRLDIKQYEMAADNVIHPLYVILQRLSPLNIHHEWNVYHYELLSDDDKKAKGSSNFIFGSFEAFQHTLDSQRIAPLGEINEFYNETEKIYYYRASEYDMKNDPIGVHKFYDSHVTRSLPAVLRNGCADWQLKVDFDNAEGTKLEQHSNTLSHLFQLRGGLVKYTELTKKTAEEKFKQGTGQGQNYTNKYSFYLHEAFSFQQQQNKLKLRFIQEFPINIEIKRSRIPLLSMLRARERTYTQWKNFQRRPKRIMHEHHICLVAGKETFILVSPIYRANLYVGLFENYPKHDTPLDFFNPKFELFPDAKDINFLNITLAAGDCLYAPAFYYIQSQTADDHESIIITQEYAAHSEIVNLVMDGLDQKVIGENNDHELDRKVREYISWVWN